MCVSGDARSREHQSVPLCEAKFPTPIPNDGSHPINVALWDSANTMHMWKEVSDEIESHLKALMAKIQKASKAAALRAAKRKR